MRGKRRDEQSTPSSMLGKPVLMKKGQQPPRAPGWQSKRVGPVV